MSYKVYGEPVAERLPTGFKMDKRIKIKGTVKDDAISFKVEILYPGGIVFQMKADFNNRFVTCNSYLNGTWEIVPQTAPITFVKGKEFEMTLTARLGQYHIGVTGVAGEGITYKHPRDLTDAIIDKIDTLKVNGDLNHEVFVMI